MGKSTQSLLSGNLLRLYRWFVPTVSFLCIHFVSLGDSNESGFADSNTFPLDTTNTGSGGNSGFADSNTFPLDTTNTGPGGNSGFADSNSFPLDTTNTGPGGNSGFADSNILTLPIQDREGVLRTQHISTRHNQYWTGGEFRICGLQHISVGHHRDWTGREFRIC